MSWTIEELTEQIDRQQRATLPRLGAGQPVERAYHRVRWVRELFASSAITAELATRVTDELYADLEDATKLCTEPRQRVAAARAVFGYWRNKVISSAGMAAPASTGDHLVYVLHDARGVLLYVGITDRGPVRLVEHYRTKPWFPQVHRVEFERYETRAASEAREKYLIQTRAPLHNIVHNRQRHIAS